MKYLEYLSAELSNGKRPHEMIILCEVIKNGFCRIADISAILEEKYQIFKDEKSIISACKLLEGEFLSETVMENKYGNVKFIETKKDIIDLSVSFRKELTNGEFLSHILDIIKYSQIQYENIYENDDKFKLYKKYSRKDVCRLLNWEKNNESTIYGYRIKNNTCPIFVTYEKSEDINESTKYDDRFINKKEFSWMTRSRVKLDSREATEIINSDKNGLEIYLFVKKDDDEGSDFYYIGKVKPNKAPIQKIIENDNREKLPIVNFNFEIESVVREDIYDYFTKKSPKSC